MLNNLRLDKIIPKNKAGEFNDYSKIRIVKKKHYQIQKNFAITGAAPKEFVKIYEYERGVKRSKNVNSWPTYIVKTSIKYYPIESIIEQLNTDIGLILGFKMAESKLFKINEQIRLGSKYFLEKDEELLHGADLFAGYLNNKEIINEIELKKLDKDFFNVQNVHEVLINKFRDSGKLLFSDFIDMLLLDAFIGVNDRHQYNWGVIRQIEGKRLARFAPIYDTARSLLWNETEINLFKKLNNSSELDAFLKSYNTKSCPKIGWDGLTEINHFKLIELLMNCKLIDVKGKIKNLYREENFRKVVSFIEKDYVPFLGKDRAECLSRLLSMRSSVFQELVTLQ